MDKPFMKIMLKNPDGSEYHNEAEANGFTWPEPKRVTLFKHAFLYAERKRKWWQLWKPKTWSEPVYWWSADEEGSDEK